MQVEALPGAKIQSLCLSGNGLGPKGGVAVAASVEANKHLLKLDLCCNAIGEGALALAKMVGVNGTLTSLDLRSNEMAPYAESFREALSGRTKELALRL